MLVLCSLLNDWNYFWKKHCNLTFLAICRSLLPLLIFLSSSWYQKAKNYATKELAKQKKMINYRIKGLYKSEHHHWILHIRNYVCLILSRTQRNVFGLHDSITVVMPFLIKVTVAINSKYDISQFYNTICSYFSCHLFCNL